MKILDTKAPLKDPIDAIFWAALEASVASDYDCRMAYARCLESGGASADKERLATLVNEWMAKTLGGIQEARKPEPAAAPTKCDCGAVAANSTHYHWCQTMTGISSADRGHEFTTFEQEHGPLGPPLERAALAQGIARYKRKVARLEEELEQSRGNYSRLLAASTKTERERWSGPRISELKARNEQLAALVVKLGGNPQPAQRLVGEREMSLREIFGK